MEALHILAPSIYIIEDVYRSDLVVYIRVYIRVIIKALIKFNTRYIAKKLVFAVFDLPRHLIWLGVARHFLASIWCRPSLIRVIWYWNVSAVRVHMKLNLIQFKTFQTVSQVQLIKRGFPSSKPSILMPFYFYYSFSR